MSAPLATLRQTEQEGDTAAATSLASSPPQSEIISRPETEPIPSQQQPPTIDPDAVHPTSLSLEETIIAETITSNPSAHDHYPDHRDYNDERDAPTSERISEGAPKDISTPLEPSLFREVYHSLMFSHCLMSSSHAFISLAFIPSRCSISYWTHIHIFNFFMDINFLL